MLGQLSPPAWGDRPTDDSSSALPPDEATSKNAKINTNPNSKVRKNSINWADVILGLGAVACISVTMYIALFVAKPAGDRKNAIREAEREATIQSQRVQAEILVELKKLRAAVENLTRSRN